MRNWIILNTVLLCAIAALGYGVALYFDGQGPNARTVPNVIVQPAAPIEALEPGTPVPDFAFTTPGGETHRISDFAGKVVVLNFWASWCPPCVKEFPHFIRLAQEHPEDVAFIGLSWDLDEAAMQRFTAKMDGVDRENIYNALDREEVGKSLFGIYKLPETLIIDRAQMMQQKIIGADWEYTLLEKEVKKNIGP